MSREIGRIAYREEGTSWNAYWKSQDGGLVWLGSIARRFVDDADRRERFMTLMQDSVAAMFKETSGAKVQFKRRAAPENETRQA